MEIAIDGRATPTINGFKKYDNGGKGSGNFGHSGRPGKVGGSGDGKGVPTIEDEPKRAGAYGQYEPDVKTLAQERGAHGRKDHLSRLSQEDYDDVIRAKYAMESVVEQLAPRGRNRKDMTTAQKGLSDLARALKSQLGAFQSLAETPYKTDRKPTSGTDEYSDVVSYRSSKKAADTLAAKLKKSIKTQRELSEAYSAVMEAYGKTQELTAKHDMTHPLKESRKRIEVYKTSWGGTL